MWRLTVVFVLAVVAVASHGAAAARAASCVNAMPVSEVATKSSGPGGLTANGLTVSRGITPEPFDVTVLGVLEDGVAPDVDMIVVKAESEALDDAKGIWAGMSGSPVYEDAAPGRLIGAVAYGLSFGPSMIGGLAAAGDMSRLLDLPAAAQKTTIQLTRALQDEVAATGAATARQAEGGLRRLRLPLAISGLSAGRLPAFARLLGGSGSFIPYSAGAATAAAGNQSEIVPGGNFAAALSYGDVSAAGVGTTTDRCGDSVIAFGHPMIFAGPTALSAHTASAITIQDDPTLVPYKLANVGGVVGTVDQDRLSGIRALLGPKLDPIEVESNVTDLGNEPENGVTRVNRTVDVPGIAAGHLLANIDREIDRIGSGGSVVGWTVAGTVGAESFSLTRNNRFADPFDIAVASSGELFEQLAELADNPFAEVTFDGVTIKADLGAFQRYRITGLQRHNGADWVRVDPAAPLRVAPGSLRVRVLLAAHRSDAPVPPVEMSFAIPQDAAGSEGSLDVLGGAGSGEEGGFFEELFGEGPSGPEPEPASFNELLASLQDAQRGDELVARLQLFGGFAGPPPPVASVRQRVAEVVSGTLNVMVQVEGGEPPFPGEPFPEPFPDEPGRPGGRLALGGRSPQKLATALKRGIRITVRTSRPGRLVLKALLGRRAARKLGIEKRVVASLTRRVGAGRTAVKLKLNRGARKRLRDATRVKLTIQARITSRGGTQADRFSVVLKRRPG
jgi:SpoIVB peptidase S55